MVRCDGLRSLVRSGALTLAVGLMLVCASHARAATAGVGYGFVASFGSPDLLQVSVSASSVAVDQATGNVLIADPYNQDIKVYAADPSLGGTLLTTISDPGANPTHLAVDPGNGALYVNDGTGTIHKYTSDGLPTPTYTEDLTFALAPGALVDTTGPMAVDPTTHDVLISDPATHQVKRFSAAGAYISAFDGSDTQKGTLGIPYWLAVGPAGDIYVVDGQTIRVERFSAAGVSLGAIPTSGQPYALAADPVSGQLAISEDMTDPNLRPKIELFSAAGVRSSTVRYPATTAGSQPRGVAFDGTRGRLYGGTDNMYTGRTEIHAFDRGTLAGLDAPAASSVGSTTAHLDAAVDTNGVPTDARFEYCPDSAPCAAFPYSDSTDPTPPLSGPRPNPWVTVADHVGITGSPETIGDDLSGLEPNMLYHVRVYAKTGVVENVSAESTFTTQHALADVQTGSASEVGATTAVLNATVDPRGTQTTYHFEYGTTTDYGMRSPTRSDAVAGGGRTAQLVSRPVDGLLPSMTYHFRVVATNAAGVTFGADQTFTTDATAQPVRGYEQVTPVDKKGAPVNAAYGFQAKADGSAIEYATEQAAADAPSALMIPRQMSVRGSDNWHGGVALDPPFNVSRGILASVTLAVSSDFTHAFVATNRALAPGATEGWANLYVEDIATRTFALVGSIGTPGALADMIAAQQEWVYIAGASDFSWVLFNGAGPFVPGAPPSAVYRWTKSGGLSIVSRLPNGNPATGSLDIMAGNQGTVRYASDDGNISFFAFGTGDVGVYRRAGGSTTALSVSRIPADPPTPHAGRVLGASADGKSVMFASDQLLPSAPASNANIYRWSEDGDTLTYVGTMATGAPGDVLAVSQDAGTIYYNDGTSLVVWRNGVVHTAATDASQASTFASPNGRYLAWVGGDGDVHVYDADADTTACASCYATGAPAGGATVSDSERAISNRRPLVVNDQGAVFFNSPYRLVEVDRNSYKDVYEYQRGRLTLISPGNAAFGATFADASDSGSDVFFSTGQGLVGQDDDEQPDLYDARVGGGLASQSPTVPVPCQKASCSEPTAGPVTSGDVSGTPQPNGPPHVRTNQAKMKVSLKKVSFTSKAMHLSIAVSQRGRVRVTGSRVAITVRDVSKAGTYRMIVPLSKKARSLKRAHRKFKVTAKVTVSGGWSTATTKISRTLGK